MEISQKKKKKLCGNVILKHLKFLLPQGKMQIYFQETIFKIAKRGFVIITSKQKENVKR